MSIKRQVLKIALCFLGALVIFAALAATIALAAVSYGLAERISGYIHLSSVRKQMTRSGNLQPLSTLVPESPTAEYENGTRLIALMESLKGLHSSDPAIITSIESVRPIAPGIAAVAVKEPIPIFAIGKKKAPPLKSWQEFEERFSRLSHVVAPCRTLLLAPVAFPHSWEAKIKYPTGHSQELLACLRASFFLNLRAGRISNALDDLDAMEHLAALIGRGSTLIMGIIRTSMWSHGVAGSTWELLQDENLTDEDLVRLQSVLSRQNFVDTTLHSFQAEAALVPQGYRQIKSQLSSELAWYWVDSPDGILGQATSISIRNFLWPYIWADGDQAWNLSTWNKTIVQARASLAQKKWEDWANPSAPVSNYDLWRFPFSSMLRDTNVANTSLFEACRAETYRQLILAAIGLKRYWLRHNRYPDSLSQLVPTFLDSLPHDWFDGGPLKYRRLEADQFLLYSVGKDGRDDNGDASSAKPDPPRIFQGRDAVWPRTPPR